MKRLLSLLIACVLFGGTAAMAQSNFSSKLIGVGVVVSDIEKSVDFYVNGIGMVKTGGFNIAEDFAKRSGLSNGVPFAVTVLKLENSPDANEWKLISIKGAKATHPKQNYIQDDVRPQYITINVKSLKQVIDRLTKMNVKLLGSTPTTLNAQSQFAFVQDPDGNFIELIGPM
ncbi:VOC family protein [Mucilaginibacter auburnensis]|uniref:Catechol 2,3-dioxygenase-like lactoylglutathione lyase family enzyme n=1 Tax=Mucilaginibacter auburnensis TaxID=1457233 RepID=A0A2H9VN17_9SPHI|nr:VOC family protein [Mucilaginibacter auburnensis]PJJ79724.1 catechol 2,3-dioxygenase-like lactoylglutathione lyase family enzyme [Mucilaginibacter auburnensis]